MVQGAVPLVGHPGSDARSAQLYVCAIKDYAGDCATSAPGTHSTFIYEIVVEPIRIVILWLACASRAASRAAATKSSCFGGGAIDAADGQLDKVRDLAAAQALIRGGPRQPTSWQMAALNARAAHGVQRRTGGVLPYFFCTMCCRSRSRLP